MPDMHYTLITGASEGFGKSLALECAARKMNLILVALPGPELYYLADFIKRNYEVDAIAIEKDLTIEENCIAVYQFVREMKLEVNMLINNAGLGGTMLFTEGSFSFYQKQIKLNIIATTLFSHLFLDMLKANGPSYILNVGSLSSYFYLTKKQVYGATKSFIYSFSKSLRRELKNDGISVSVICPGSMNTNISVTCLLKSSSWISQLSAMNPEDVAPLAITGLLNKKEVIIPGRLNKIFLFINKLLPDFLKNLILRRQMKNIQSVTAIETRQTTILLTEKQNSLIARSKNQVMKKNRSFINYLYNMIILIAAFLLGTHQSAAQPYLDIVNIKYSNSPNTGVINHNRNEIKIQYFGLSTNLPIQFKNKKDAVIISPFFENWIAQSKPANTQRYYSIALPVTLSKSIKNTAWSFLLTGILRMNDSKIDEHGKMQAGGAFILNNKRNENLTWKLGIYVNNEFFNVFVMPLAGIDWKIDDRNKLFGVLPGNLTYEHRINDHFYYGACFRAITNSYYTSPGYWRIDENQLGLYLDAYLSKAIVLNIESGHSLFRKLTAGVKDVFKTDADVNDNFYFKLSMAYRVRFKK